jgi:hypothetical protein
MGNHLKTVQGFQLQWERAVTMQQYLDEDSPSPVIGAVQGILKISGEAADGGDDLVASAAWRACVGQVTQTELTGATTTTVTFTSKSPLSSATSVLVLNCREGMGGLRAVLGDFQTLYSHNFLVTGGGTLSASEQPLVTAVTVSPLQAVPKLVPMPGSSWYMPPDRILSITVQQTFPPGSLPKPPPTDGSMVFEKLSASWKDHGGITRSLAIEQALRVSGSYEGKMHNGALEVVGEDTWLVYVDTLPVAATGALG